MLHVLTTYLEAVGVLALRNNSLVSDAEHSGDADSRETVDRNCTIIVNAYQVFLAGAGIQASLIPCRKETVQSSTYVRMSGQITM